MERVTTGYYRTNGEQNSIKPSGKCSHGGLSDAGAKGIECINKDSTLQTYSPHWFLHRTAAALAIAHTRQYLADLLQDWPTVTIGNATYPQPKVPERHLRLLLGLNPGSIAFVIDRSRSMATSLSAVKGAIRAVVTRLQKMGYLPFQWVLVGYGQSYETVATVTSDINVFLQVWAGESPLLIARFFFWNAGTLLQKSREGLLRSIIFGLLRQSQPLLQATMAQANKWALDHFQDCTNLEYLYNIYDFIVERAQPAKYLPFY